MNVAMTTSIAAFMIPGLPGQLLAEGALQTSLLPVLSVRSARRPCFVPAR
jgi:peptidoglycan biosynthesis protein MviN/MurJ (putative lipid II flippase)